MRHFIVTGALLILLTVSRDMVRLHQSKAEVDAFKETEMDKTVHGSCFFFLFWRNPSFLLCLCMQQPWLTQQWHHGGHSYFYWLGEVQLCPCYATCPICSSQQPPGKKMSTTQKWLRGERWNVICACHATVLACFTSQMSCHRCHSCTISYLVSCSMDFKVDNHCQYFNI